MAPTEDPAVVEAAWNEEIARRIEDLDSGKAQTVPGKRSATGFRPNLLMAAKSVEFLDEARAEYEEAFDWYFATQ